MAKHRLRAHLEVEAGAGAMLGDARVRLLEAIERTGSITKAARRVPMSYKTAWDALDALDNLADAPVIERSVGGVGGGGATLTAYGRWLVAMFRAVEGEYQAAVDSLAAAAGPEVADKAGFQRLLRRLTLRTSARNQFACTVRSLLSGPVMTQVVLVLDGATEMLAHITTEGLEDMRLAVGQEVVALVQAPLVMLLADPSIRTSVQNHLTGTVSRIHEGPLNSEVVIDLPPKGIRHVTSVVQTEAIAGLGLTVGAPATAAFQASSLLLVAFGS